MSRSGTRMRTTRAAISACVLGGAAVVASCASKTDDAEGRADGKMLTEEQLMDPESCKSCHPSHFREWSGSMHAYAGEDPLFLAMNARMQRLTNGAMGDFCVRCHAPVATRLGATTDGKNLAALPQKLRGVTCFFCHAGEPGGDDNNNPLVLQHDGIMRGGIANPVPNTAHVAQYSTFHDREAAEGISSVTCGPCHDIVTRQGAAIERTFKEWTKSVYAAGNAEQVASCGQCHMPSRIGIAADVPGVFERRVHDHSMPGVDIALQPFPETEPQRQAVQAFLDDSLYARLCVRTDAGSGALAAEVSLRSVTVGHGFPSGSAQDRRVWVELVAFKGADVVKAYGQVRDDQMVPANDPNVFVLRDTIFGADGKETHNFWEATRFESTQLSPPQAFSMPGTDSFLRRSFAVAGADRVTMVVHVRPIDIDIVQDLIATGDLTDTSVLQKITTFTLASTALEWKAGGTECVTK